MVFDKEDNYTTYYILGIDNRDPDERRSRNLVFTDYKQAVIAFEKESGADQVVTLSMVLKKWWVSDMQTQDRMERHKNDLVSR